MLYKNVVDRVMSHIKVDIRIITSRFTKLFPNQEEELEEEMEEEETVSGKTFQGFRYFLRILWRSLY